MPVIRLEKLLKSRPDGGLEKIVQRAQHMGELTQILKAGLEPELAHNLLAANLRDDGELVLICSSSAWAARLRFQAEALLKIAAAAGMNATRCKVRVGRQNLSSGG